MNTSQPRKLNAKRLCDIEQPWGVQTGIDSSMMKEEKLF
jgi:hypothetical protein